MTDTTDAASTDAPPTREFKPGRAVGTVARMMEAEHGRLSRGDVADLRRMDHARSFSPALWRTLAALDVEKPGWFSQAGWERRWAILLSGMAHTVGLHDYEVPLGRALAKAGWSEVRFVRLMRAEDDALAKEVRRLAQYLASKSQPANWADVADLLFWQTGTRAEADRLRIARAYYGTRHADEQA